MTLAGTSNLPVAPRETKWDPIGARQRVFAHCGTNVASISRAFLWRKDGDARSPEVWDLLYCDVIGGVLHIIPKGLAQAAGRRGIESLTFSNGDRPRLEARITTIYDRVRSAIPDWPVSPFAKVLTADASGDALEGVIAFEGVTTGDGRRIEPGALTWDEGPWPLVFDREEMDHSGATIGTINSIRRVGKEVRASAALSDSEDPDTALLVTRARELLEEGAVGVSVSLDDVEQVAVGSDGKEIDPESEEAWNDPDVVWVTKAGRIRSVAIVDEAALSDAKLGLVASLRAVRNEWFSDPKFGNGILNPKDAGGDERLVWQEPERPEEEGQFGCPLTITDDGRIFGHAALWGRCHVGYPGTCVRPPKEHAAYRGFLTGERVKGVPTGPLVMKTRHAPVHLEAGAATIHYEHTGYAPADVTLGPDAYGIWVSGALRSDATEQEIEILRASALSGDWRPIGGRHRLVGVLAVNAPGFRVARALAASGALITVGPGCNECDDQPSLEDRIATIERILAQGLVAGIGEGVS